MRGRKKNPFLTEKHEYKGKGIRNSYLKDCPWTRGRIYDYEYTHDDQEDDFYLEIFGPPHPYEVLLPIEEAKSMGKENDVSKFLKEFDITRTDGKMWVLFTDEEFINFRRTKIMEHNLNEQHRY